MGLSTAVYHLADECGSIFYAREICIKIKGKKKKKR